MDNPTQATSVQAVANSVTRPVLPTALPRAETATSAVDTTTSETSACRQQAEETLVEEAEGEVTRTTNPTEAAEDSKEDSEEDPVEAFEEDFVEQEEIVVEEVKPTKIRKSLLKKKVTVNNCKNTWISLHYFLKIIT